MAPCCFAVSRSRRQQSPCRRSTARVTDLTGTLSGGAVTRIEAKLADLEAKKGSQIAVLIVPTTQPEEIEQYGIRVADAWKLGRKGVDDGAILIVAKDDRRVRIEVGYGLGGRATRCDRQSHHRRDHHAALQAGRLRRRRRSRRRSNDCGGQRRALAASRIKKWERHSGLGNLLPLLLIVVFVASGVLRAMFGRLFGSVATGGLAGGIVWLLSHVLPIGFGAGVLAFMFALLTGGSRAGGRPVAAGAAAWRRIRGRLRRRRRFRRRRWWRRIQRRWRGLQRRRRLGELVMQIGRLIRHAAATHWRTRMLFPAADARCHRAGHQAGRARACRRDSVCHRNRA